MHRRLERLHLHWASHERPKRRRTDLAIHHRVGNLCLYERIGGVWQHAAYLKPSTPFQFDEFGSAVTIQGDVVVVGAMGNNAASSGVNGDENNGSQNSGAAHAIEMVA